MKVLVGGLAVVVLVLGLVLSPLGLNPFAFLKRSDSYHFFKPLGDLILTGRTRTNVKDVYMILVGA